MNDSVAGPDPQFCKSLTITQVSAVSCQLICLLQSGRWAPPPPVDITVECLHRAAAHIVCGDSAVIFYQFGQFRLHWEGIFITH